MTKKESARLGAFVVVGMLLWVAISGYEPVDDSGYSTQYPLTYERTIR